MMTLSQSIPDIAAADNDIDRNRDRRLLQSGECVSNGVSNIRHSEGDENPGKQGFGTAIQTCLASGDDPGPDERVFTTDAQNCAGWDEARIVVRIPVRHRVQQHVTIMSASGKIIDDQQPACMASQQRLRFHIDPVVVENEPVCTEFARRSKPGIPGESRRRSPAQRKRPVPILRSSPPSSANRKGRCFSLPLPLPPEPRRTIAPSDHRQCCMRTAPKRRRSSEQFLAIFDFCRCGGAGSRHIRLGHVIPADRRPHSRKDKISRSGRSQFEHGVCSRKKRFKGPAIRLSVGLLLETLKADIHSINRKDFVVPHIAKGSARRQISPRSDRPQNPHQPVRANSADVERGATEEFGRQIHQHRKLAYQVDIAIRNRYLLRFLGAPQQQRKDRFEESGPAIVCLNSRSELPAGPIH